MQKHVLTSLLTVLTLALGAAPTLAADYDPRGLWQTTTGESRYQFAYCGTGHELCATLVWLNEASMSSPAAKQLGSYAYSGGKKTAANAWRGRLFYDGKTTQATVTQTGPKHLTLSGCYFIWCQSFDLVKIGK